MPRRSRVSRRASTTFHARSESKLHGLLSASSSMITRRHSFAPSTSEHYPNTMTASSPCSDDSEDDFDAGNAFVKKESRTPSPSFLSSTIHHQFDTNDRDNKLDNLTYSSLPPSPIADSPPLSPPPTATLSDFQVKEPQYVTFSIWDYLREELLATDFDSHQELKWERVSNFLSIPLAIEKVPSVILDIQSICLMTISDFGIRIHLMS